TRLQRELGLTYLIITHNLAVVRHVSDEMAIMYMGRFVEHGTTREIFERAAHPYTAGLLAAQPHPDPDNRRHEVPLLGEVPGPAARRRVIPHPLPPAPGALPAAAAGGAPPLPEPPPSLPLSFDRGPRLRQDREPKPA